MTELEIKFGLEADSVEHWRDRLISDNARQERFVSHYFDTATSRLATHGISLRLRSQGGHWKQTVKVHLGLAVQRLEHEVALPGEGVNVPALDVGRHTGSEAGKLLQAALGKSSPQLSEQYVVDVERIYMTEPAGASGTVELALDTGEVRGNGFSEPIAELEFELQEGLPSSLFDAANLAVRAGGLWLSTETKAQRGQRLSSGAELGAVTADPMQLSSDADAPQFLRAVLRNTLAQILPNASAVALGSTDKDVIHQLRVGLRRLRTALRELAGFIRQPVSIWEKPLSETFGKLGELRDNEAVADAVKPLLLAGGALKTSWTAPPLGDSNTIARAVSFQATLVEVLRLAQSPDEAFLAAPSKALRKKLVKRLEKLHREVTEEGQNFEQLPLDSQHQVRKRVKRLRYLTEFVAPLWPAKDVSRYLKKLKPVQEALGSHNDTAVAASMFRNEAARDPAAWFSAGLLQSHLASTSRSAGKALRKITDSQRFW